VLVLADPARVNALVQWVNQYDVVLQRYPLLAPTALAESLEHRTRVPVSQLRSPDAAAPNPADTHPIAAAIAAIQTGQVRAVIYLIDPNLIDPNVTGSNIPGSNIPGSNIPGSNIPGSNVIDPNVTGSNQPHPPSSTDNPIPKGNAGESEVCPPGESSLEGKAAEGNVSRNNAARGSPSAVTGSTEQPAGDFAYANPDAIALYHPNRDPAQHDAPTAHPRAHVPLNSHLSLLIATCSRQGVPLAFDGVAAEAIARALIPNRIAHLIFNPVAGQGNSTQDLLTVRQILNPYLELHIHLTTPEIDAETLVQQAIAAQPDVIIASGGDGTVSVVASALINTGIPLGLIPRGTANAFAVALGIPTTVREACQLIAAGTTRIVDTARSDRMPMILLAGIGFEAGMVERANRELKDRLGVLAYILAGVQQLQEQQLFDTTITVNGTKIQEFRAGAVTIANTAPPTSVLAQGLGRVDGNDGQLDITLGMPASRLKAIESTLELFGAALVKLEPKRDDVVHFQAQQIRVETSPPQKVTVDGELVGTTPIEFECLPQSLIVIAPPIAQPSPLERVARIWVRQVSPSLTALTAAVGAGGLAACAIALWILGHTLLPGASSVMTAWDQAIAALPQTRPSMWGQAIALSFNALSHPAWLAILMIASLSLTWRKQRLVALTLLTAVVGITALSATLSVQLDEMTSPAYLVRDTVFGFSGSRLLAAIGTYGILSYFWGRRHRQHRRVLYGVAGGLIGAIALSRVYLLRTSASEAVIALCVGVLWIAVCAVVYQILRLRAVQKRDQWRSGR
jgi:YegS/Rv2252/BmrU family lipid kinase